MPHGGDGSTNSGFPPFTSIMYGIHGQPCGAYRSHLSVTHYLCIGVSSNRCGAESLKMLTLMRSRVLPLSPSSYMRRREGFKRFKLGVTSQRKKYNIGGKPVFWRKPFFPQSVTHGGSDLLNYNKLSFFNRGSGLTFQLRSILYIRVSL